MTLQIDPPAGSRAEVLRIVVSMTVTCALGALLLGGVYVATENHRERAQVSTEGRAVREMLALDAHVTVREVRQYLSVDRSEVVYRQGPIAAEAGREVVFTLDGQLVRSGASPAAATASGDRGLEALGRVFVASLAGRPLGFVVEGEARGYKNRIRFFVAVDSGFTVSGVRVIEHEEDPGLGAEIATPWFQGQFVGRPAAALPALDVTRDPMPEDWSRALATLARVPAGTWRARHAALVARESERRIYAATGATISSRALTDGVRTTVDHFRRRWRLVGPHLGGAS
jgi:electron transport complex protein RnfG